MIKKVFVKALYVSKSFVNENVLSLRKKTLLFNFIILLLYGIVKIQNWNFLTKTIVTWASETYGYSHALA